jgi:general secretion pathway protein G
MPTSSTRARTAFTLVEILIVVVILGIMAAMVIPQFARAAQESSVTATQTELSKIRRHLEMYRIRHADRSPEILEGDGTWGQLVGPDHLQGPPTNAYVGGAAARTIIFRDTPDTAFPEVPTYGWIYSAANDEIWAAGFDGQDQPLPR